MIRTGLFLLPSVFGDTRRERQYIKAYMKHTLLTPTQTHARCLRSQFISAGQEPDWSDQTRKSQPLTSTVEPPMNSFQNPQILRTISSGFDVNFTLNSLQRPSSPISCRRVYYDRYWLSYHFRAGIQVHCLTTTLEPEAPSCSNPYRSKLWNIINENWLIQLIITLII